LCSVRYIIERKALGRGALDEWFEVERNVSDTKHRLTGYDPQLDCLYRIRAANEFGISDPSLPVSYYGKQSKYSLLDVNCPQLDMHDF
jgi:hypothetical protein